MLCSGIVDAGNSENWLFYIALHNVVLWYKPLSRSVLVARFPSLEERGSGLAELTQKPPETSYKGRKSGNPATYVPFRGNLLTGLIQGLQNCKKLFDIFLAGPALPPSHISLKRNYYKYCAHALFYYIVMCMNSIYKISLDGIMV